MEICSIYRKFIKISPWLLLLITDYWIHNGIIYSSSWQSNNSILAWNVLEALWLLSYHGCHKFSDSRHFVAYSILKIPLFAISMMIFDLDLFPLLLFLFLHLSLLHFQFIGILRANVLDILFFIRHFPIEPYLVILMNENKLNNFRYSCHFTILNAVSHKCRFWN